MELWHEGIHGVDISSAGFMHNPERLFAVTNAVNEKEAKEKHMHIELYPFTDGIVNSVARAFPHLRLPVGLNSDTLYEFKKKYPHAQVARVHLPFAYNNKDWLTRAFSDIKKPPAFFRHFLWRASLGVAKDNGISLAAQIQNMQDSEVMVSGHANVIAGFAQDNTLMDFKNAVSGVLVESAGKEKTAIPMDSGKLYDPRLTAEMVTQYDLAGLVFGIDHALENGDDVSALLKNADVRQTTHNIHLAGPHHDIVTIGDERFTTILQQIAMTSFAHPLRTTLDYNPHTMPQSTQEQVTLLKNTRDWIFSTQTR